MDPVDVVPEGMGCGEPFCHLETGVCVSVLLFIPFLMATLRTEPRGLCMLSRRSATELLPKPTKTFLISHHLISVFTSVKETSCVPSTRPEP